MKRNKESTVTCRAAFAASLTACVCMGLSVPLLAAQSPDTSTMQHRSGDARAIQDMKPAQKCLRVRLWRWLSDVRLQLRRAGHVAAQRG
jgi:hypothetical protein